MNTALNTIKHTVQLQHLLNCHGKVWPLNKQASH